MAFLRRQAQAVSYIRNIMYVHWYWFNIITTLLLDHGNSIVFHTSPRFRQNNFKCLQIAFNVAYFSLSSKTNMRLFEHCSIPKKYFIFLSFFWLDLIFYYIFYSYFSLSTGAILKRCTDPRLFVRSLELLL